MLREPWFWRSETMAAKAVTAALSPFSGVYDLGQRIRWQFTRPHQPKSPIICIGNAALGGVGKTPFAIALFEELKNAGTACQFLSRGYGGDEPGPLKVDLNNHHHPQIGDEALLLANHGPVWVSRDRAAGSEASSNDGAAAIIMDDGLQNPTVNKTFSILLLDAMDPDGNGKIFPSGPLREPIARAQTRADITVAIGRDEEAAQNGAKDFNTPFAAWLEPFNIPPAQKVVAFSGIGNPEKFFQLLQKNGFEIVDQFSFPDHHPFTSENLSALQKVAIKSCVPLITTEKDHVRLPTSAQSEILSFPVRMRINQPALLTGMVLSAIDGQRKLRDNTAP